ncbi:MAG TPA: exopolysaccharide biosynthesis polyprenyl glycosylphosphotransferase [Stellaceae bacterium]|nr:exopolysaccharide biosynthesis polyprenyl glycosylphosphotransferase [Stellaceae bacterium]
MSELIGQKFAAVARQAPPLAGNRGKIDPRLVSLAGRLADGVAVILAGIESYRAAAESLTGPVRVSAGFIAATILLLLALFTERQRITFDNFLSRSLANRLLDAGWRILGPFLIALLLTAALAGRFEGGAAAPLIDWQRSWAISALTGVIAARIVLSLVLWHWRARGRLRQTVAVVGTGDLATRLIDWLQRSCGETVELLGVFDDRSSRRIENLEQRDLLRGTIADLIEVSKQVEVDRVLIALPHAAEQRLLAILGDLRQMPVDISLAPDMIGFAASIKGNGEFAGLPLISVHGRPLNFGQRLVKGGIDRALAAAALLLTWPLLLFAAVAVKLDSPGPVLFCQIRFGFGNRTIRVYKFRTMRTDMTDHGGARQVEPNDPRITRIGHFLRRTSIDELPQIFNVLRGEMSIVGPRPMPVQMRVEDKLNHQIVAEYARRHHIKPGITGWAQVNGHLGRVATAAALRARVAHDLYYIENWSLWFDLRVILMTFRVIFRGNNEC